MPLPPVGDVRDPGIEPMSPESPALAGVTWEAYIYIYIYATVLWASLVAQMVKNLPAMRETWVQSLDWEDPLEDSMATHSSILAWRIPWTEEPGGLQTMGSQRVGHD